MDDRGNRPPHVTKIRLWIVIKMEILKNGLYNSTNTYDNDNAILAVL